jgi:hypothetical protein
VDGHHPHTKFRGGGHGTSDLVRDVVELQVEKHSLIFVDQAADEPRTLSGKEGAPDLDAADLSSQAERELDGMDGVVDVQGD